MFNRNIILFKDDSLNKIASKVINYPLIKKDLKRFKFFKIEFIKSLTVKEYYKTFNPNQKLVIDNSNLEKSDYDACFLYELYDHSNTKYKLTIVEPVELFYTAYIFSLETI